MPNARILVVEDDASLNDVVTTFLKANGYTCAPAFSGSEASLILDNATKGTSIDLVITDLMLPGLSGASLISCIRERLGDIPVIVMSAKGAVADRINLLRCGADDYLVKPFDLDELLARVEVQLRHRAPASPGGACAETATLAFGSWELAPESRRFSAAGRVIKLTRTEFNIVRELMRHPRRAFSKGDLYRAACREDLKGADMLAGAVSPSDEKSVTTHIGNLRAKLKGTGTDDYIETVWGIGFKLKELD